MDFKLEICVDSIHSALTSQESGASRIELCDNLVEGGTTPGYGTIMLVREKLGIGMNVIIRPRGGDFLYSPEEIEIMRRDIALCKKAGVDGVVIGILKNDGFVDVPVTKELVQIAAPMSVTFHRAFDMCSDPVKGLEDIISCGVSRILTSGQKNTVPQGIDLITRLVGIAGKRIIIMPGSGITEKNISEIALASGAKEFHLSVRKKLESRMIHRMAGITMGAADDYDEYLTKVADGEKIRKIVSILSEI